LRKYSVRGELHLALLVILGVWALWLVTWLYVNVYLPHWQREQASALQEALYRDCRLKMTVHPQSIYPSRRPWWNGVNPRNGLPINCEAPDEYGGAWVCKECSGGP